MSLAKKYLAALFVVFLHFAVQIRSRTNPRTRCDFLWDRGDAIALVADLFGIALVCTAAVWAVERLARRLKLPILRRIAHHLFLVALLSGIMSALVCVTEAYRPILTKMTGLLGMAAIGFSLARPRTRLVRWGANFCLVFSPVVFVLSAQILWWGPWDEPPRADVPTRKAKGKKTPVFVLIFDEWSYPRSTENGEFRPFLRNIRDLCERSAWFREARSPSDDTRVSIPCVLYHTDRELVYTSRGAYWQGDGEKEASTEAPNLFTLSREHGYNSCMVGWFLPYSRLLGDSVDYCHTYPCYPQGESVLAEMGHCLVRNMQFWRDPVSERRWKRLHTRLFAELRLRVNASIRDELLDIVGNGAENTFAVFHLPIPHHPFLWNADGSFHGLCGDEEAMPYYERIEGYERTLAYLDFYVGQVVERLKQTDRFDDALLILTADHSWRWDPDRNMQHGADWRRRVPLIIKLPGQKTGTVIDEEIRTNQLQPLLEAVFAGERDPERLLQIIRRVVAAD